MKQAVIVLQPIRLKSLDNKIITPDKEHINRWREMYYCRRCDVVYVPGDDVKPQNPDKTVDLCYYGVAKR